MALEPGQVVDNYRLDQIIHRGRATTVYAATDLSLRRKVAFKVLVEDYARDPAVRQRFVSEAQTAASLDAHPNIVTVYSWGQVGGSMYFVTAFIAGISLAELIERQPGGSGLPVAEAMSLLRQTAGAIDFAHRSGAIHRDVKPANIMVKMTETPRTAFLVDFGITKMGDGDPSTPVGEFVGTPDYAAPEQVAGEALDERADVYSFACTAFDVLTGRPPFADAPDDEARLTAQRRTALPSISKLRPELSASVDAVFAKATAKVRDERYATCTEFVDALRAELPEAALEYRRPVPLGTAGAVASLEGPATEPRRRWPWLVVGVVLVLVAAAVGWVLTDGTATPRPSARSGAT